jgi:hypothetical protein
MIAASSRGRWSMDMDLDTMNEKAGAVNRKKKRRR